MRGVRRRADEFVVASRVAPTAMVVGVEQGIVLAIVASIVDHLRRSYHPSTAVLIPGPNDIWHGISLHCDIVAWSLPGLVVYRFAGSLYYANANLFFEQTSAFASTSDDPLRWLCLDAAATPDVDYSGGETIRQLHGELQEKGIKLVIAEAMGNVRDELDRYGITALLGGVGVYPTVIDAVQAFNDRSITH